ncbi:MAG: ABC transporter substrate-binding protein [Hyphomicrobiaceae bacterium]
MNHDDSVIVVLATSESGRAAPVGLAQRNAIETAVERWNAAGGVDGRQLALHILDDSCSADGARRAARAAVDLRAAVVIGHPCAAASEAAASDYQTARILFFAAGSRHPRLTEKRAGPLVFRASGRDDRQGFDAAGRLVDLAGPGGEIALVHDRTAMARAIVSGVAARLGTLGRANVTTLGIVAGETNYAQILAKLSAVRPAAVFFAGFPAEAAILLRQIRAAGIDAPVLLSASNATVELPSHAGDVLDERVEVLRPVASVEAGWESGGWAAADAVTALQNWVGAARAAGTIDANAVAARLTPAAGIEAAPFDASGDIRAPSFRAFLWQSGSWVAARRGAAQ